MKPPRWADKLIEQVCEQEGVRPPRVRWRGCKGKWSKGRASGHFLELEAGSDVLDQRHVLLHELAHVVTRQRGIKRGHSADFWRTAFYLYSKHLPDLSAAYAREQHYKVGATTAAAAIGIPEAVVQQEARRAERRARKRRTDRHDWQLVSEWNNGWSGDFSGYVIANYQCSRCDKAQAREILVRMGDRRSKHIRGLNRHRAHKNLEAMLFYDTDEPERSRSIIYTGNLDKFGCNGEEGP